jgi:hypothetical protein
MKIRSGFVSNSSSSSFLLVGFSGKSLIKIMDKLGLNGIPNSNWEERLDLFKDAGFTEYGYGTYKTNNGLVIVESYNGVDYIGVEAERLLNNGGNVREIGSVVVDKLKELSPDIDVEHFDAKVLYGTASSEW